MKRRGVTLLEVLVAAVVLATGITACLSVIAGSAAAVRRVEEHSRGLMFARSKMDEILKEPLLQTGTDQGQGIDETTDFDWQATIEPSQHPSLVLITVVATHRVSGYQTVVTALRRPDLDTPPEGVAGSGTPSTTEESGGVTGESL
ncbi:MAG: prepilin-type N-terminal cleavage/methylation domain-containing protein [Armatimonadota bacterium]